MECVLLKFTFTLQRPGHEEATIKDSEDFTINIVCDLLMVSGFVKKNKLMMCGVLFKIYLVTKDLFINLHEQEVCMGES